MGRVLALDIGDRRVGVALSDESRLIASPHSMFERVGWGPDAKRVLALVREAGADLVVSGLPRNMDGSLGFQARKVMDFCDYLTAQGLTVVFQDERLSTVTATDALILGGVRREDRKQVVDKVAAAVILQAWLDARRAGDPDGGQTV